MASDVDQSAEKDVEHPRPAADEASGKFWYLLIALLFLVIIFSWDYGIKFMFGGLSFVSIGAVLVEIARRGRNSDSKTPTSMLVDGIRNNVLKTPLRSKIAKWVLICFICFLLFLYVVLPPLKFDVQVQGLNPADIDPIQLSLNREPNKVETNASGYATVELRGLNCGYIEFLRAYSPNRKLALENKRLSTFFLWRHRFEFLAGPIPLIVSKLPSAKERAEILYQSSLVLIQSEDFAGAISKLDQGLAIEELDEPERTKLLKAKELCLLWKTAPGSAKKK